MPRLYRSKNGDGVEVRTVSLTTFVAALGVTCTLSAGVIGSMNGALHERDSILRGIATTEDLSTMAAGLKQGIDALDQRLEDHKLHYWHAECGIVHAESRTDRASIHRDLEGLAEDMDRYHMSYRGTTKPKEP